MIDDDIDGFNNELKPPFSASLYPLALIWKRCNQHQGQNTISFISASAKRTINFSSSFPSWSNLCVDYDAKHRESTVFAFFTQTHTYTTYRLRCIYRDYTWMSGWMSERACKCQCVHKPTRLHSSSRSLLLPSLTSFIPSSCHLLPVRTIHHSKQRNV